MLINNTPPLLYDFTEVLSLGDGHCKAWVQVAGKALVEVDQEEGETSIIGIYPGGFWGLGATFEEAWPVFYENLKTILSDLAAEADGPECSRNVPRGFPSISRRTIGSLFGRTRPLSCHPVNTALPIPRSRSDTSKNSSGF